MDRQHASWPRLPRGYVARHRLWSRLDASAANAMTLVIAPAGAGKSLGVAGWLRGRVERDPEREGLTRWVHVDGTWTPRRIAELLDDASDPVGGRDGTPSRLVIDDAQLLPTQAHRLLGARLDDDPESMRVVLLSRWDLPIAHLVPELLGNVTLIRGDMLRLDEEEARGLIVAHARTSAPEVVEPITRYANGWCAAVVLAARAVAGTADPIAAVRSCLVGDTRLSDRVASEVFASLAPQDRHLLLCLSAEDAVTPGTAEHLANDPLGGEVLADLEATGLLVSRLVDASGGGEADGVRYRIHPLLKEVVRRRLATDGVDIAAARATVVRAVLLDAHSGHTAMALPRLTAVRALDEASAFVSEHGVAMVMRGEGAAVAAFVRDHQVDVDRHPRLWFPLALERWVAGDAVGALAWLERYLGAPTLPCAEEAACARLMRARMGNEPMAEAVASAREVLAAERSSGLSMELLPQLLTELAITQNWLGDLAEAEGNLSRAAGLARTRGLPALEASALSHLALTRYMLGHEHGSIETVLHARAVLGDHASWLPRFTGTRLDITAGLARAVAAPGMPVHALDDPRIHPADLCSGFWLRIHDAYAALADGDLPQARRLLQGPADLHGEALPDHLRVVWQVQRAALGALARDRALLRHIEQQLTADGCHGEAAWVGGMRADLDGERRAAVRLFVTAAEGATHVQPAVRPSALVAAAQLLDELGRTEEAHRHLWRAIVETEVRRNTAPYLGWTRQGTPISVMLARLAGHVDSSWVRELLAATATMPSVQAFFDPGTATSRELVDEETVHVQTLTAREHDVLQLLASGSSYADVSAALAITDNTTKTHVSNLYAKLGAGRRSEALAVARAHHLI